jgi:alkanesulfonate monooxygenase SsuD/methylene tetrahydromethanopterin reductase-like flavin-dependent oxidoreductase (luciferase family)
VRDSIKIMLGMVLIVQESDEKAQEKYRDFLSYGDREGILALFGGWTGIDMSKFSDEEDFALSESTAVRSLVQRWNETVPGSEGKLKWNKNRIVEYLTCGGVMPKVIGSPSTVVDEMERWVEMSGIDGFNLAHVFNPGSFEDIVQ